MIYSVVNKQITYREKKYYFKLQSFNIAMVKGINVKGIGTLVILS